MEVTPNFHMNGNCKEAISFYEKALHATVLSLYRNSDANPQDYQASSDEKDFVYHAEIVIGGRRIIMSDDTSSFPPKGNTLSLALTFDSAEEVKKAFQPFAERCQIIHPMKRTTYCSCFVSFLDPFGVRWEFMTEQADC